MAIVALLQSVYTFLAGHPLLLGLIAFVAYQKWKMSRPFPESGGRVKAIHSEADWQKAKASGRPFVVDFYATWCPPCRAIAPVFGEISEAYPQVDFYKVDVDEMRSIAQECGIRAMPTFQLFQGGREQAAVKGASRGDIEAMLNTVAAAPPAVGKAD